MKATSSDDERLDILAELEKQQGIEKDLLNLEERINAIPLTHVLIQLSLVWAALGAIGLAIGAYFFGLIGFAVGLVAPGVLIFLVWTIRGLTMRRGP